MSTGLVFQGQEVAWPELFTGGATWRCDTLDLNQLVPSKQRCPRKATWVGKTRCRNGHETNELACDVHHAMVVRDDKIEWRCDICRAEPGTVTRWDRL